MSANNEKVHTEQEIETLFDPKKVDAPGDANANGDADVPAKDDENSLALTTDDISSDILSEDENDR